MDYPAATFADFGSAGRNARGTALIINIGSLIWTTHALRQESWETYATTLANASSDEELADAYSSLIEDCQIKAEAKASVVFARDTRPSSTQLVSVLVEALKAVNANYVDYKLLTTPQLHYITRCLNTKGSPNEYGDPTEDGYYAKMAASLKAAMHGRKFVGSVTVDCANGVGGPKLRELIRYLPSTADGGLDIKVTNDDVINSERLNHQVCAPYRTYNSQYVFKCTRSVRSGLRQNKPASPSFLAREPLDEVRFA